MKNKNTVTNTTACLDCDFSVHYAFKMCWWCTEYDKELDNEEMAKEDCEKFRHQHSFIK